MTAERDQRDPINDIDIPGPVVCHPWEIRYNLLGSISIHCVHTSILSALVFGLDDGGVFPLVLGL